MENKRSLITVLIVIIAFLSLTLAAMAGYLLTVAGNPGPAEKNVKKIEIPDVDELGSKKLFNNERIFNLKNDGESSTPVIKVSADIRYFKKVKGVDNVKEKIDFYESSVNELIGTYFQKKTLKDVMKADAKEEAKNDLIKQINKLLSSNEEEEKEIVYTIIFDEWFYQ